MKYDETNRAFTCFITVPNGRTNECQIISNGERIAQLVFLPYLSVEFIEVEKLNKTERGDNGFGSTGR